MTPELVLQCIVGALLGLWLHFLKKAREDELVAKRKVTVVEYVLNDRKEAGISVILTVLFIVGLPEVTEFAQQVAQEAFNLKLPALERSFFLSALLGGFGNSLADFAARYFGGSRLTRFLEK